MRRLISRTLLRALLRTRHGQRWCKQQKAVVLGAPENEEKLWGGIKADFKPLLEHVIVNMYVKKRNIGTRLALRTSKAVSPYKKFLITLTDTPLSVKSAERCIESAKRYGEDYNLEIMPAVSKSESVEFFIRNNLTFQAARSSPETLKTLAQMGCFASHFKLWRRCVELGKPVIALEHDAVFRAPVPDMRFKHVIVLSSYHWRMISISKANSARTRGEKFHYKKHLYGTHAYAITPEGARRLIGAARKELLEPVDWFMHKKHVSILCYYPLPIYEDPMFSSINATFRQ